MRWLLQFLFPSQCRGCGAHGSALCGNCSRDIPLASPTEHSWIYGIFSYQSSLVRTIMYECKYHKKTAAFELLAEAAIPEIKSIIAEKMMSEAHTSIVFVPIALSRTHKNRGFNQAAIAAKTIARALNGASAQELLMTTKKVLPQAKIQKRSLRLSNVKGSMKAKKRLSAENTYIIIDDVTTTGATFIEAKRALREAGARAIIAIALAHGYKNTQ